MNYSITYFKQPEKKIVKSAKTWLMLLALFFFGSFASAQDEFITEWKTDNTGVSTNKQITIPAVGTFNYTWKLIGGATTGTGTGNGSTTITFPVAGNYEVKITPTGANTFRAIQFTNGASDARKLLKITQWGTVTWSTFERAFTNTSNLAITATDVPLLTAVTDMSYAFYSSKVSTIPNINDWNVYYVTNMSFTFALSDFNSDIGNWNVRQVTTMEGMFSDNSYFNQDISRWNVSEVTTLKNMFFQAFAFDQNLGAWNISKVTNAGSMFKGNMSCQNYSKTLGGWAADDARTPINITLGASSLKYSPEVISARDYLINDRGWNILNDSQSATACPIDLVTEWNTQGSNTIIIPAIGDYTYSWVDLNNATRKGKGNGSGFTTIDFGQAGTYELRIFPLGTNQFFMRVDMTPLDNRKKLMKLKQWGAHQWTYFNYAFEKAENLSITATDIPDLRKVTSMDRSFFESGISTVPNINLWDVSQVTNMYYLFGRTNFNDNVSSWDVSKVQRMSSMFGELPDFNQDISNWNVENVEDMYAMFAHSVKFNQNIGSWNTSKVKNISHLFMGAKAFNQDISQWDTSKITNMTEAFIGASAFDQNIGSWNLNALTSAQGIFDGTGLSCLNYSKTLKGWANNTNTPQNITSGAEGLTYSPDVVSDRNHLINNLNWNITEDALGTCALATANADFTSLKLFPNPVKDYLTIHGLDGKETVALYDLSGRLLQTSRANGKEVRLNLSLYAKGMYLLTITSEKGSTTKKIIKQ